MKVFLSDIDSLYDRYSGRLFHTSLRIVGDRTEAEQIMHDTLLKWLRRSPAGPGPGATPDSASDGRIEAWLVKVCVRASIDAIRRRRTLRRLFPERSLAERIPDEAETEAGWSGLLGDSRSEATEKVERIRRGMSRLPAGYRAVLSLLLGRDPLFDLLSGGLLLGAIFMATDYTTSPINFGGRIVFAIGCGVLTILIREFGSLPEGVSYSIVLMNIMVPLIERAVKPRAFGKVKAGKAGAK